ncbi:MAG: hypothetical protein JST38_09370 [Bacteroidetes bacterium]|nr:hypothetical protein [Bacteroidota bacterium]
MRNFIILSAALLCAAHTAHATDRVVSPTGTYNTISSAIAASSDGDRILVEAANYPERIAVSKSITFLPALEGGRYTLEALRLDGADGKAVHISGMRLTDNIADIGTYSTRTTFTMVDSYARSVMLYNPYIHVELYRDTILTTVLLSSGRLVGCTIPSVAGTPAVIAVDGTSLLPDDLAFIGNVIGLTNSGSISIASDKLFRMENNFIRTTGTSSGLSIARTTGLFTPLSTVINNTFYKPVSAGTVAVTNSNSQQFALLVANNATINFPDGAAQGFAGWTQLVQSHNLYAAPSWIDLTTGQSLAATPLIDAGDPDPRYLDLDLTTNDVGCYGGSNSRANFTMPMGSAVVGFMQAPRVVSQGDAVNISATGFDR